MRKAAVVQQLIERRLGREIALADLVLPVDVGGVNRAADRESALCIGVFDGKVLREKDAELRRDAENISISRIAQRIGDGAARQRAATPCPRGSGSHSARPSQ